MMVISTIRRYARFHDFGCLRRTWGWISTWKTPIKNSRSWETHHGLSKKFNESKIGSRSAENQSIQNHVFGNGIVTFPRGTSEIHVENPQKIFWQRNQLICYGFCFGFIRIRRLSSALGVSKRHRSVQGGSPIPNCKSLWKMRSNLVDWLMCTLILVGV